MSVSCKGEVFDPEGFDAYWTKAWSPKLHNKIPPEVWAGVMVAVMVEELQAALSSVGIDKAPGVSQITMRMIRESGPECLEVLAAFKPPATPIRVHNMITTSNVMDVVALASPFMAWVGPIPHSVNQDAALEHLKRKYKSTTIADVNPTREAQGQETRATGISTSIGRARYHPRIAYFVVRLTINSTGSDAQRSPTFSGRAG
ncbi:hypothetical protein BCR44DRAFT_58733 [Catenaria anguillulae PL171]|uniref:Uncharacterized protein n=1 Tax=Catenaria anguillulae PL171 TaxID=765915 RepID=A0A1Y2I185_9FUNG|nr:hypothetical protein BCR44DRAFT_58733 [Catenaria anguillulae PL171]